MLIISDLNRPGTHHRYPIIGYPFISSQWRSRFNLIYFFLSLMTRSRSADLFLLPLLLFPILLVLPVPSSSLFYAIFACCWCNVSTIRPSLSDFLLPFFLQYVSCCCKCHLMESPRVIPKISISLVSLCLYDVWLKNKELKLLY